MFIEALLIIAKSCKQPKRSPTSEWLNTLWYIYTTQQEKGITNDANDNMDKSQKHYAE